MEEKQSVGKLIEYLRTEAGISQDELCRGICSRTFLARLERGERVCEKIVSDALMQRTGVAADRFVFSAGPEEQMWLVLWEEMYRAVDCRDREKADLAFEEYRRFSQGKSVLHQQLLLFYQAVLGWKRGEDKEKVQDLLCAAWKISREELPMEKIITCRLTLTELCIAMMQARVLEDMGEMEGAVRLYEALLQYLDSFVDERDSVRLYPQMTYRLSEIYIQRGEMKKAVCLAERGISLLKKQAMLYYLRPLLEIVLRYGTVESEERKVLEEGCSSIQWLYEHFGVVEQYWNWDISFFMAEYDLCGEMLKARREVLGMSQEELAEGICDPVTVSRIECGKVSPKRGTFEGLMKKVGLNGSRHKTDIPMGNPENWKLATDINRLLNQGRGEAAEPLIALLEERICEPDNEERQFLLHAKALALGNQGKLSREKQRDMYREALYLTLPCKGIEELKKWYYTMDEVSCVNSLAHAEDRLGEGEKYIEWLYTIKRQYKEKFLGLEHYARRYELTCRTLGDLLGNAERYEEGIQVEYDGIRIALKTGLGSILSATLYDCGWNMEHLWESGRATREESLCYMKASYFLHILFGREQDRMFVGKHIEKMY